MLQKARALAESKGGACLVETWTNVNTKIPWRCSVGHIWETTYAKVGYTKSWCPECAAIKTARTLRDRAYDTMTISALKHDFRCDTSKEDYINVLQKVGWTCLKCSKHFNASWKTLATTCKFSCWQCDNIAARKRSIAEAQQQASLRANAKAELAKNIEAERASLQAERARASSQAAKQRANAAESYSNMNDLFTRDQPRYSKAVSRTEHITSSHNRGCAICQGLLEAYNRTMCTSCEAREKVQSEAACDEIDELVRCTKALNTRR